MPVQVYHGVVSVPSLLQSARDAAGLTQASLARRAGTSQAAVARYEAGVASPSVSTLERLLRAAGLSLQLGTEPAPAADLSAPRAAMVRSHRREILAAAQAAGASNVRIFGSVARGDDDEDSDIDLLVSFDASQGLGPIIELKKALEEVLGEPVDVAPEDLLRGAVARAARREAVPL